MANARITSLLTQPSYTSGANEKPTKTLQIPGEYVGFVIGKGGDTIKKISQESGCRLQTETEEEARQLGHTPPMQGHQFLHLVGSVDSANVAEKLVKELLQKKQRTQNVGGASFGPHHHLGDQLRVQPYPTFATLPGYAQFAPQAYAFAPNVVQGYSTGGAGGYGRYLLQSANVYPSTASQFTNGQAAISFQQGVPQPYPVYPSQHQQPPTAAQHAGYMPNMPATQLPLQNYFAFPQQQQAGVISFQQPAPTGQKEVRGMQQMQQVIKNGLSQPIIGPQLVNHVSQINKTSNLTVQQYQPALAENGGLSNQPVTST